MPPVVIPVAAAALAGGIGVGLGVTTIASAAIAVGVTAASAGAQYLLTPHGSNASPGVSANPEAQAAPVNGSRAVPMRQAIPPRRFVYGRTRVGGAVFFQDNNNPLLLIGSALSDGPIEAIESVYFGETSIPLDGSGNAASGVIYTGNFNLEKRLGSDAQTASAVLLANFPALTSDFRQRGVACAVASLDWGTDAQNSSVLWGGSVSPSYLVKGVKVYDPRDGTQTAGTKSTYKYSATPALHIGHALQNAWGVALANTYIDWASFGAAATLNETTITYGGVSVPMLVGAGVFQSGADMASQLAQMLSAIDGALLFVEGKYTLFAAYDRASVWTVTDDDILELPEFPHDSEAASRFGSIKAQYYDASGAGTNTTTPVYELVAGGRETSLALPFTSESHSAQILAYRALQRSQKAQTFPVTVSDAGLWLNPFDVITIASSGLSFLSGTYEVLIIDPIQDGATLLLRPYSSEAFNAPSGYLV